ncbi:MAG TPA: hypothetical protein PKZ51_10730 [Saprospiraceae bacterium]|jgi:hypothetical protein|nr:hypothetical protein [Ferruginibacter sp.]MBN8698812.1 hypothetical protein [Chitinophagales bacterium]HNA65189.1 hypothetical protein [Saprospiraceae bacterium]
MDYRKNRLCNLPFAFFLFIGLITICVTGCGDRVDNVKSTYYLEFINCTDSLGNYVIGNSTGKVAFYKDNKLEIVSKNYITGEEPGMHYLELWEGKDQKIPTGTTKIRVEKIGLYAPDSVRYSMQKYRYDGQNWNKISDMGTLKAVTTYNKARLLYVTELGKQLVKTIAEYSFQ